MTQLRLWWWVSLSIKVFNLRFIRIQKKITKNHEKQDFIKKLWLLRFAKQVLSKILRLSQEFVTYTVNSHTTRDIRVQNLDKPVYYEMPQKECERLIFYEMAYAFFSNTPKSKTIICGSKSVLKLITRFFKMLTFYVQFFAIFSHFQNQIGKLGHIKKIEHKKWTFKKTRDQF